MIPAHRGPLVRTVASGILVAIAVITSMHALTLVIDPGPWLTAGTTGVILVSTTSAVVRYFLIRAAVDRAAVRRAAGQGPSADRAADRASGSASFVATAAGVVVAFWFVLARYGGPGQRFEPFVGPDSLDQVIERFRQATETMSTQVAPVGPDEAISMVAVGGTLLVLLVMDSLAGARMPGFTGVPLLLLWTPPLTLIGEVPWLVFVISVTAMLLLLTVDPVGVTPGRHSESDSAAVRRAQRFRSWITALTSVAVAATSLGVATGMASLPALAGTWNQLISTPSDTVELSSELDMRQPLSARSSSTVLTYTVAEGDTPGPLRVMTLTAFDGVQTRRAVPAGGLAEFDPSRVLAPEGEGAVGEGRPMDIEIGQLTGAELPVPLEPRTIDVDGAWGYDAIRDEVRGDGTEPGSRYRVEVVDRELTPEQLRSAPTTGDPRSAGYTEVPDTEHRDEIAAYAQDVAGDAATRFDAAVALQNHLRSGEGFVYNPDADYRGSSDTVWDFLQNQEGYCTQYALSMMVMARSLDIPARIGIGWLPGRPDGQGGYRVTGQDSHAWPEIYFPTVGWVRFEPTPQVQTGPLPSYANPGVGSAPSSAPTPTRANEVPTQRPTQAPEQSEPGATAGGSTGSSEVSDRTLPGWAWVVAVVVGLGVLGGAAWLLLRRRTEVEVLDPELAWSRVLALLAEQDVRLGPSVTLRRAPAFIADEVRTRTGSALPDDVTERLTALADAAEQERYARHATPPTAEELEELTTSVTTELTTALARKP